MSYLLQPKEKRRHISFILYPPDSALEWTDAGYKIVDADAVKGRYEEICSYLSDMRVKCCISPIHDSDHYDQRGIEEWIKNHSKGGSLSAEDERRVPKLTQIKKPHWHVYYYSKGGRTKTGLLRMFGALGVKSFWVEDDAESAIRYQAHIDDPDKARYDERQIRAFGGLSLDALDKMSSLDKLGTIEAVCAYIKEHETTNFFDLVNAMLSYNDPATFECLITRTAFFTNYMGGLAQKIKTQDECRENEHAKGYKG